MENHHKQLQNYKVPLGLILGDTMANRLMSTSSEKNTMFLGGGHSDSFTQVIDNNIFNQLFNKVSSDASTTFSASPNATVLRTSASGSTIHKNKKRNTTRKSEPRLFSPTAKKTR